MSKSKTEDRSMLIPESLRYDNSPHDPIAWAREACTLYKRLANIINSWPVAPEPLLQVQLKTLLEQTNNAHASLRKFHEGREACNWTESQFEWDGGPGGLESKTTIKNPFSTKSQLVKAVEAAQVMLEAVRNGGRTVRTQAGICEFEGLDGSVQKEVERVMAFTEGQKWGMPTPWEDNGER